MRVWAGLARLGAVALVFILAFSRPEAAMSAGAPIRLVALGDSLTAGYGLAASQAFPAVLEKALREKGLDVTVENEGISGDTTSGGLGRIDDALARRPDGLILELGANDALRGFDPGFTRRNMEAMLDKAVDAGVPVLLCGMYALLNMGADYGREFRAIYDDLAAERGLAYYPFFLEGVFGKAEWALPDGLHPNAQGVKEIVERILPAVMDFVTGIQKAKTNKDGAS